MASARKHRGGAVRGSVTVEGMPNAQNMRRVFHRTTVGISRQAVARNQTMVKDRLKAPGPVARPIEWTSEAQRIAVIIKLREEGNLPYQRTGATEAANRFYVSETPDGATIILENRKANAKYVYGGLSAATSRQQQRMHINTGWPSYRVVRDDVFDSTLDLIDEYFVETLLAFGFLKGGGRTFG